jgi:hypothetical protein
LQKAIRLLRVADDQPVDAVLTSLTQEHLDSFETLWKPRLQIATEEDRHWDWIKKNRLTASCLSYEKYVIEYERINQGMMMIEIDGHRSLLEPGKNIVYVDLLATAPWNRQPIQNPPQFRGVGRVLLEFARLRSLELEYGGRVALHSLPRAESFYTKNGMKNLGSDPDKQNLAYFEWGRVEI